MTDLARSPSANTATTQAAPLDSSLTMDPAHRTRSNSSATLHHEAEQEQERSDAMFAGGDQTERDLEKGDDLEKKKAGPAAAPAAGDSSEPEDPFLVTLKGREHLNPHTWSEGYRWALTVFGGLMVLNATFASTGPSQLIPSIIEHFGVSQEVGVLTIALFVAGYCVGPLLWGPLSERQGRKRVFVIAWLPYVGFQVGCALSPNIGSLLVFRFLGGCFAAAPVSNVGGFIADLWDADKRGIALCCFSLAPFAGPAVAPIIAGAFQVKGIDWRWIFWFLTIFSGVFMFFILLLPETYVPFKLVLEAQRLRKETGDDRWHAPLETHQTMTFKERMKVTLLKPMIMQVQEPMLLVLNLYMSLIYGLIYLLFEVYPIIYIEIHGWNSVESALPFLGLPIGGAIAVTIYVLKWNKDYIRKTKEMAPKRVPPEARLIPLMWAAPGLAIAIFWLGLTGAYKSVNAASPIIAGHLLGGSILLLFTGTFSYIIDTYLVNAASAIAANTIMRSTFGAGFPLFATQMFHNLGVPGATALLGGLATLFVPAPFVLYRYGRRIRMMSKNAKVLDD